MNASIVLIINLNIYQVKRKIERAPFACQWQKLIRIYSLCCSFTKKTKIDDKQKQIRKKILRILDRVDGVQNQYFNFQDQLKKNL